MNERDTTQRDNMQHDDTMQRDTIQGETAQRSGAPGASAQDVRDSGRADADAAFLPGARMDGLRDQWDDVQAAFVDDPRSAVQQAQELVADLVDELTQTFARERATLEEQWSQSGQADTETLRIALQRYRSFFNRLLQT